MPLADYICENCGFKLEQDFKGPATATVFAPHGDEALKHLGEECLATELHRVWVSPHMGAMSSGEPPR